MDDDDFWSDEYEGFECDCADEEIDVLEGRATCWQCGNSRSLSSAELKEALRINAVAEEAWAEEMARTEPHGGQNG